MSERQCWPLPLTIEEIDAPWLTAALRTRAPGVTVRAAEVVDVIHGTCTKIRLRLDMDDAGKRAGIPKTVMLKGGFEKHSRKWAHMHEEEVRGYRDVQPVLKLPSPVCYFADYEPAREQGIVIMEDLVARGVTFCDPLKPQTHDEVARRLTVLAQHHAKTWDSKDLLPGGRWDWALDLGLHTPKFIRTFLEPETYRRYIDSPRAAAASVRFHDPAWIASAADKMGILAQSVPHCLTHGDTHLGNLYVDVDGTPGFFDSLPHNAPGLMEIAYHVGGALDLADRRRWEGALIQHYLDELARNGVTPPSFDDAMRQYGVFLVSGYGVFLFNASVFQTEAINTAYTARFSAAMVDNDTIGLLKAIG